MANIVKPSGINQLWAAGGTKVAPSLQKMNIGWVVELPPYQFQNWLDNRQDTFIAHINQHGIPEWDVETEYQGNLSYTQGSDGFIYKCLVTNTGANPVNPLNSNFWVRAFETYGSVAVVQNQLTQHLTNYATLSGISNPVAARNNLSVYSKVESDVRFAALAGNSTQVFSVGNATAPSHAVPLGQLTSLLLNATESQVGQISLATTGETEVGANDTKAITPLKASNVFAKKSNNLSDLPSKPTARTNLGLGDIATENAGSFLRASNNLSEITSASSARTNLGLGTSSTQAVGAFLQTANNLSDVVNKPAARANLGLTSVASADPSTFMYKSENLAGLSNIAAARNNLGLADTATIGSGNLMFRGNNLGDVSNVQAARNNLGLGSAATMNAFGTNGSLDFTSSNGFNGYTRLPNGLIMQWGQVNVNADSVAQVTFPTPFPNAPFHFSWMQRVDTGYDQTIQASTGLQCFGNLTNSGALILNGDNKNGPAYWFAIGV